MLYKCPSFSAVSEVFRERSFLSLVYNTKINETLQAILYNSPQLDNRTSYDALISLSPNRSCHEQNIHMFKCWQIRQHLLHVFHICEWWTTRQYIPCLANGHSDACSRFIVQFSKRWTQASHEWGAISIRLKHGKVVTNEKHAMSPGEKIYQFLQYLPAFLLSMKQYQFVHDMLSDSYQHNHS